MFMQCAERIGRSLNPPSMIRLDRRCLTVLQRTLLAVWPQEGCALLLGSPVGDGTLRLMTVWPACNRWGAVDLDFPWTSALSNARERNFALDPREQLSAQRWSRSKGQRLLGVAHSHPSSDARPSAADRQRGVPHQLMLIIAAGGEMQAWWLREDRQVRPVLIDVS